MKYGKIEMQLVLISLLGKVRQIFVSKICELVKNLCDQPPGPELDHIGGSPMAATRKSPPLIFITWEGKQEYIISVGHFFHDPIWAWSGLRFESIKRKILLSNQIL